MNQKKAKALRKTAKSIYPGPTQYDDKLYKVNPEDEHLMFMDGALAQRTMKEGSTRKMYKDLKKGSKGTVLEYKTRTKGIFNARRYRKLED